MTDRAQEDVGPDSGRPEQADAVDLLAIASHEIRTPLGAILTTSEALLATPLDNRQARYATTLREAAVALLGLTDSLLSATTGHSETLDEEFNPDRVTRSVVDLFLIVAGERNLQLELENDQATDGAFLGAAGALRQILTNLVDNALKYTVRGAVRVSTSLGPDNGLEVRVADSGSGIEDADRETIFMPYRRLVDRPTRASGHGIGLWMSRRIAENCGGDLTVETSSPDGTVFLLRLPVRSAGAGVAALVDRFQMPKASSRRLSVLVVDDNSAARRIADMIITAFGWHVICASSASEALELLSTGNEAFDCVLTDITMPGLSGYELARSIKELVAPRFLPVLALSAATDGAALARAEASFSGFIAKPYTPKALYEGVLRSLEL